ncbi:hypothetical protein Bca52824_024673 [Brassica carinata]|uniref:Uncharacterized protein n=1 Tax=Brassica carinata TaxID=52824 RepID=A0A8X7VKY1_BRACI|nr:hypothetical protein Bca52824_024673 [Brassica carinata]
MTPVAFVLKSSAIPILQLCQRSSQCPMCWQSISLKDPTGQELLEAVVQERSFRFNPPRNATIFRHPTLGDFELQNQAYFKCVYECFDRSRKQEEIANCVEHCSIPVVKSQQYFEGEMAQFQVNYITHEACFFFSAML